MLKQDFKLRDGYVDVPMGPGLGIEIDDEAIQNTVVISFREQ